MSQRNEILGIFLGVFLVFGMHVLAFFIFAYIVAYIHSLGTVWLYALEGVGLSQLVYVTPMILWARHRQRWGLMKGMIIGAVLTALLNGGCWLLIYPSMFG